MTYWGIQRDMKKWRRIAMRSSSTPKAIVKAPINVFLPPAKLVLAITTILRPPKLFTGKSVRKCDHLIQILASGLIDSDVDKNWQLVLTVVANTLESFLSNWVRVRYAQNLREILRLCILFMSVQISDSKINSDIEELDQWKDRFISLYIWCFCFAGR